MVVIWIAKLFIFVNLKYTIMSESKAHQRFTELIVWKQGRAYKLKIYELVKQFPKGGEI